MDTTRRRFLQTASGAAAWGLADLPVFRGLNLAGQEPRAVDPDSIRFSPDMEPLVRLIEETPREKCVPVLAEKLRGGLPYRQFLSAILLAALRKTNSHHSVYLVQSVHQESLDLRPEEGLLPLFWAVDHYKWQQSAFPTPPMAPLKGVLPSSGKAAADFHDAMHPLDPDRAERTLVALARSQGGRQIAEELWPYACRDLGAIGHRAIAVTSCQRVLDTVGWEHAETVLRFVVRELKGEDQYYRSNLARADGLREKLGPGWAAGAADRGASLELFALLRQGKSDEACTLACAQVAGGTGAQAVWDAVHGGAAELMILHASTSGMANRPLHLNTAANALRHAFSVSTSPRTRLLVLLQAVAWVADFIRVQLGEKNLKETKPADLEGAPMPDAPEDAVADFFSNLPPHTYAYDSRTRTGPGHVLADIPGRVEAGRKAFALATRHPDAMPLYMKAARTWLSAKATVDAHEYKFPAALFEDLGRVSPEWRPRLLAASAHWLHGRQSPDSPVLQQAREASQRRDR